MTNEGLITIGHLRTLVNQIPESWNEKALLFNVHEQPKNDLACYCLSDDDVIITETIGDNFKVVDNLTHVKLKNGFLF